MTEARQLNSPTPQDDPAINDAASPEGSLPQLPVGESERLPSFESGEATELTGRVVPRTSVGGEGLLASLNQITMVLLMLFASGFLGLVAGITVAILVLTGTLELDSSWVKDILTFAKSVLKK